MNWSRIWDAISAEKNNGDPHNSGFAWLADKSEHIQNSIPQDLVDGTFTPFALGPLRHINDPIHNSWLALFVLVFLIGMIYAAYATEKAKSPQKKSD